MPELTPRDEEILEALTHRIRVLTLDQISRTWWQGGASRSKENALRRLRILEAEDIVQIQKAPAHPELPMDAPVLIWLPGACTPDFGKVSYQLQSRWNQHPVLTVCVSATALAARRFAGHGGRFPREVERTHDIHMAAVYLRYRAAGPTSGWTFEERLRQGRRRPERLPDVILETASGMRVIEFGGSYTKAKIKLFHQYCMEQNLPYEVW